MFQFYNNGLGVTYGASFNQSRSGKGAAQNGVIPNPDNIDVALLNEVVKLSDGSTYRITGSYRSSDGSYYTDSEGNKFYTVTDAYNALQAHKPVAHSAGISYDVNNKEINTSHSSGGHDGHVNSEDIRYQIQAAHQNAEEERAQQAATGGNYSINTGESSGNYATMAKDDDNTLIYIAIGALALVGVALVVKKNKNKDLSKTKKKKK